LYKILQGSDDKVVPPSQAEEIVKIIRDELHGKVEYEVFEGEGHGWRRGETVKVALEKELGFYEEILGLKKCWVGKMKAHL
jgi:dipeptidyl aminopeptidase/acylaminoacyl peptidase